MCWFIGEIRQYLGCNQHCVEHIHRNNSIHDSQCQVLNIRPYVFRVSQGPLAYSSSQILGSLLKCKFFIRYYNCVRWHNKPLNRFPLSERSSWFVTGFLNTGWIRAVKKQVKKQLHRVLVNNITFFLTSRETFRESFILSAGPVSGEPWRLVPFTLTVITGENSRLGGTVQRKEHPLPHILGCQQMRGDFTKYNLQNITKNVYVLHLSKLVLHFL